MYTDLSGSNRLLTRKIPFRYLPADRPSLITPLLLAWPWWPWWIDGSLDGQWTGKIESNLIHWCPLISCWYPLCFKFCFKLSQIICFKFCFNIHNFETQVKYGQMIRPHNVETCWTLQRIQQVRRRLLTLALWFWLSLIKWSDVPVDMGWYG